MNNKLYGNLIFELSNPGTKAFSLPKNCFPHYELSPDECRSNDARLPECDELTVVRHYTNLSGNNFGVDNGFYPLGSCTMKYNPAIDEDIASHPTFKQLHPLQPASTVKGAIKAYELLGSLLSELTGMSKFTLNPCAGAHGELTGLMIICAYHESRHDKNRTKIIIPDSAHGTNPASAAMCGLEVIEVKSTPDGRIDVEHLKSLLSDNVAGMMMTNPNTLGLFEYSIPEITRLIHDCGGLMYYDGANLNPLLGQCRPGDMGFDVMHVNLHKTFSTPHGGGGPGSGPVGVRKGLENFLPSNGFESCFHHGLQQPGGLPAGISIHPYHGNFAVELRALAYILSLGREHIGQVGALATLNANYIKECLKDDYELPINGLCQHEFVFNGLKDKSTGVTTMDIAKRLLDYGFHAPTIYFPLLFHEAMMIEPTESESKRTIDQFIDIMHTIAREAREHPELVKSAPHNTPIRRVNDVQAAKQSIVTFYASIS